MKNCNFCLFGGPFCLLIASLSLLHTQQAPAEVVVGQNDTNIERLVVGLENQILQGYVQKNREAVAHLIASDFQDVGEYGVWDKERSLQDIADPSSITQSLSMSRVRFSRLAPNVVVLTYRLDEIDIDNGMPVSSTKYVSSIWLNRDGKWLNVLGHDTPTASSASSARPSDSYFVEKENEVWEALKHKDKAAAERLLADDFVGMYDVGFFNKSEWVKQIDDQYSVDAYTIENPKVLRPGPTTALLLYTSTCKGTGDWADYCSHTSRISDLWVERNGQWQALFSQDTRATSGDQDDASVLKEILASEYRIVNTLRRDDIEGFAKLLPEDVMDIDDDGVHTKAEWIPEIQEMKDRGYLFRDFRFDDPRLIRLGADQATFTAKEIIHGLDRGQPFELRFYTNATYVRRNGKWVPRVYQDTPMVK
jgi:hypothetical protein